MNQFKAAIFDMDGLLIDTEIIAVQAFNDACKHFGLGDHHALVISCIGTNSNLSKVIIEEGLPKGTDIEAFREHWQGAYKQQLLDKPIPVKHGAELLLQHLRTLGMPVAVATSTKTEMAKEKLSAVGLIEYFDQVVGGDQVEHSKPRPEIYLRAASLLSIDPKHCVAFEDSTNGVKAAYAADMHVVQIPDLVQPTDEILAYGHTILENLEQVITHKF